MKHFLFSLIPNKSDREVLVLAGDIATPNADIFQRGVLLSALRFFSLNYKHVIYVPGNHEYYYGDFDQINSALRSTRDAVYICDRRTPLNVHLANNNVVFIEGYRFVCCTLWFNERVSNRGRRNLINDFRMIKDPLERFHTEGAKAENFLRHGVQSGDIVVTHHLPSYRSVASKFMGNPLNSFFVHDNVEKLLYREPAMWIHGHTHESCDYELGKTRVLCNPYGYFDYEENPTFVPQLIIDV
jgi:Icc-related predicted phosphoesterase